MKDESREPSAVIDAVSGDHMTIKDIVPMTGIVLPTPVMQPPTPQQAGPAPLVHNHIVVNQQPAFGVQPFPVGAKSKVAAGLLALFLGALGIHRFYLGHNGSAVAMLLLWCSGFVLIIPFFVVWIWALVDCIMIFTGSLRDAQGNALA